MDDPKSKEIIQAENLIKMGKAEEALEIVRRFQLSAWSYYYSHEYDKSLEMALQSKDLVEEIGEEIDFINNFSLIGHIYIHKGDYKTCFKHGIRVIKEYENSNNKSDQKPSLSIIGLSHWFIGNFNQAIKFCEKILSSSELDLRVKADNLNVLANSYTIKAKFSQALKFAEEGIKIANEQNFIDLRAWFNLWLGYIYFYQGNNSRSEEYLKNIVEDTHLSFPFPRGFSLLTLMNIYKEAGEFKRAHKYLNQLKGLADQYTHLTIAYQIAKGILLFAESSRTRDRAEAERIFKQVIEGEITNFGLYSYALYYLITIYLEELGTSNDLEILKDITPLIDQLLHLGKKTDSGVLTAEVKVFRSKLALIQLDFDKAKLLLTQAQEIGESHNIQYFTHMISNYHDELLKQQKIWDQFNKSNAPLAERIKLASFDGILDRIQGKRLEESPELIPETPVFLLIITESGIPLFSHSFSKELSFEDDIISSFISAFNTFSGELFSKGLDRAIFGEYIILLETIDSYSVCYLFKGQSYPAKQKLTSFIEELQNNSIIWQTLNKLLNTSQVAELQDIPQIENLIKDIFIT